MPARPGEEEHCSGDAGRVWMDERNPDYQIDNAEGAVFWKTSDHEIVALKY